MRLCSEYDGSVVVLSENLNLTFDNYFCSSPNATESHVNAMGHNFDTNKLEYVPIVGTPAKPTPTSTNKSGGRRQARIATTGLLLVTALLTIAVAASTL